METQSPTKPLTEMTSEELKAELQRREKDEKQALIAEKRQHETDKNDFLKHNSSKFLQIHKEMKELKEYAILQANELYDRMYIIEGREPKETKSFTLKNSDDTIKITVDRQERFSFTDEAIVHINAIKEIFKSKFERRHKVMYEIMDELLIKGRAGEYDPKMLAKARRKVRKLGDENLMSEFDKLDSCQRITGSALYCRMYIKDDKGKYKDIPLQFSSL